MEVEPPRWWNKLKLNFLWRLPLEPRKKIKRLLKLGDDYLVQGERELAEHCYNLSKELAEEVGTVHLLKKIEQRFQ
ncbi:MAG: hypothetical protein GX956_04315 [Firmicutes bacterium]|nr:hypothetical protein [Bacillota bacterium]